MVDMCSLPASTVVNSPVAAGVVSAGAWLSVTGALLLASGVSALPVAPLPQPASRLSDMAAVRPSRASFFRFFMMYSLLFILSSLGILRLVSLIIHVIHQNAIFIHSSKHTKNPSVFCCSLAEGDGKRAEPSGSALLSGWNQPLVHLSKKK